MPRKIICQILFLGFVSILFLGSCNSAQKQRDNHNSNQAAAIEDDLSDCYGTIKDLSAKMQKEGSAFWDETDINVRYHNQVMNVAQVYATAAVALTEAVNHGMFIDRYLATVEQGDNVIETLQNIDMECYHIEDYCANGIKELRNDDECITPSFRATWISVLERISNYSSEIREQVQVIRNAQ